MTKCDIGSTMTQKQKSEEAEWCCVCDYGWPGMLLAHGKRYKLSTNREIHEAEMCFVNLIQIYFV